MMRRTILAAAAAALAASAANAQFLVHDPASNLLRVAEAAKSIEQALRQYRMMEQTYNAISHSTDLQGISGALGGVSRTYMPSANQVPSMMTGRGGMWGSAAGQRDRDRYYDVGSADPYATEMQRREQATANAKAIAAAGLEDTELRISNLETLRARLEQAQDGTEVTAVNGLVAVEQQNLDYHRGQIDQARLMLAAEARVDQQRYEQQRAEDADRLFERTRPMDILR